MGVNRILSGCGCFSRRVLRGLRKVYKTKGLNPKP